MTFFIDVHEPDTAKEMFRALIPDTEVVSLNTSNKPDYFWIDPQDNTRGWERKQLGEALSDLNAVEYQLNEHMKYVTDLTLVVEGVGLPTKTGIDTYRLSHDRKFFTKGVSMPQGRPRPGLVSLYTRFKASVRLAGINVVETSHWDMTVQEIAAHYIETMKGERTTFRRYITPHISPFYQNPHVENLMRMKDNGLGPVNANALVKKFGTLYNVLNADFVSIAVEIGKTRAENFFKSIGRPR